jgi:hypothetical protein
MKTTDMLWNKLQAEQADDHTFTLCILPHCSRCFHSLCHVVCGGQLDIC